MTAGLIIIGLVLIAAVVAWTYIQTRPPPPTLAETLIGTFGPGLLSGLL